MSITSLAPSATPTKGQSHRWSSLPGVSAATALYEKVIEQNVFALVITHNAAESQEWLEALRFFSANNQQFCLFELPDREVLPYDYFSPHPDITSERLNTLYHLQSQSCGVCVVTLPTLMTRLCPRDYINRDSLILKVGQQLETSALKNQLDDAGYQHRDTVFEHGEYAVRGSLLDIYPMGSDTPYRIDLFDDEISSLRTFDPENQRSHEKIERIAILPAAEVCLDKQAINHFRDQWHIEFENNAAACPIYQDVVAGIPYAGIESYLPMFYSSTSTLLDFIPADSLIISLPGNHQQATNFIHNVNERFQQHSIDLTRPLLSPAKLYLDVDEFFASLSNFPRIAISSDNENVISKPNRGQYSCDAQTNPELLIEDHAGNALHRVESFLNSPQRSKNKAKHVLFCVESMGRREIFIEKLEAIGVNAVSCDSWQEFNQLISSNKSPQTAVAVSAFNKGATINTADVSIIAEPELFGVTIKPKTRCTKERNLLADQTIHNLIELQVGSPIVHLDHGVGRYLGLEHMPVDGGNGNIIDAEFLTLEYAGGDRLYVPVTSLHMIGRYMGGDETTAPLNKLGSENWGNAKQKAIANIHDVAAELLDIYARRKAMHGFSFNIDQESYQQFCDQFPFEETADQLTAISSVSNDMEKDTAMDRLVCGDVGFGKTEVAMRAAFIAACNSKQVMVLVPTTLLAQQHFQNFLDRFADWPIAIETLSRFKTSKEQATVMESFRNGKTDILIGTHKLIQKSIKPSDLGLVIVDEEHRFGVRQKEQLKSLCANVDLLTMTATPIPRTLNMAMAGLRDLSIIATPPAKRLSVKTFVHEKQTGLVKEALLRELLRGGQVFYLHNEVSSIERSANEIREILPDARVAVGHGQMPERELEQVMSDFYHRKFNVLVCSTIIETGIDIPNANTIIIERADKFGLAQLHQLRGRVGRSHHQAYAYLFVPNKKFLSKDAEKRLTAIEEAQDLGAGFMLATHDLEIRGAGQLLGDEQSGQMQSIGYSLYLDMLERAVTALKSGDEIDLSAPLDVLGEINLNLPALIPNDYLPDVHNRLMLYKRISSAANIEELRDLKVEMIDRFGLLGDEINNLFEIMRIKLDCIQYGIVKINAGEQGGYIEFGNDTKVNPMAIVKLVQEQYETYQLIGATRLTFSQYLPESEGRIHWVSELVKQLGQTE
ncbi:MAG: transcription-repair coupling factor [Cellvibrionales bacterium]|nr:transcription-repair coupling factor [Cellvibrionales bacterium]|tara:strand:+ start:512 stop:4033 length:3522 start_codon:yes stop_codon:yes gene_type:complete